LSALCTRGRRRRPWFGLATALGLSRRGFFIPCRHAALAEKGASGYPALAPLFRAAEPLFVELLAAMTRHAEALAAIGADAPPQPRWRQSWFPRLDAAAAYTLVRSREPRRIVEIGCGHSTRFFARAVADGDLETTIVAVDPAPRATIAGLRVELLKEPVQRADPAIFAALQLGDMLAIDSSHVLMPGTDVDMLLNRVLPELPAGVLVHFHDIFLPEGYPPAWAWRGYNEQLAVATLLHGRGWRLVWSSRYVVSQMAERLREHVVAGLDRPPDTLEASLWLEKIASPLN
jgi:hypothetical protein